MSTTLTLFEHESTPFDWDARHCALLERMRGAFGSDVLRPIVQGRTKKLQAAQYVGVVRLGNRTVQILPKIYQLSEATDEKVRAKEATRNLLQMLEAAGQLPIREHAIAPLLRRGRDWFEILTRLFTSHLLEEWLRGGYRTYHTVRNDLPVLKGKWLIGEQLKRPVSQHIFSVEYDEFSSDNKLNRIFRFVVERLWQLTRDSGNRQRLSELRELMDEVTLLRAVSVADANPAHLTRLNQRFAPLLNLSRLFLDGGTLQIAAGDLSTFAFVFDMNRLFEAFIASFIRKHRSEILDDQLLDCELLVQSRGATFFLAQREHHNVFKVQPDLVFRDALKSFPILIDTKYKRLDQTDWKLGISPGDFYQMHAYAHRYQSLRVLLLYPQTAGLAQPQHAYFQLELSDKVIEAATVDIRLDLGNKQDKAKLAASLRTILQGVPHDKE